MSRNVEPEEPVTSDRDKLRAQAPRKAPLHTAISDDRRRRLIDAAYHLIAERGMEGFRLREVAAAAGLNHATLHYYFATKADLVQAVADRLGHEFVASQPPDQPANVQALTPRKQLHWYFVATEYQLRSSPERFIVISEMYLHAQRDPETQQILSGDLTWQTLLVPLLQAGIQQGQFRADLDADQAVLMLMTFSMGLPLLMSVHPHTVSSAISEFEAAFQLFIATPLSSNPK